MKILIANRGEIALRILRACKELAINSAIVYSKADENSLPVLLSEEKVCIGPAKPAESYLSIPRIISAAEVTGCDAVHPGYGFLAENPDFAEACESCNIKFIGPKSEILKLAGDKMLARKKMKECGIPVLPGSESEVTSAKEAKEIAGEIGYPLLIKAAMGGGGKGMKLIENEKDLETGYEMARAEAKAAFGDSRVYIEKFIKNARHIEIQVLADDSGQIGHLAERECSIQRRYQKLIEEAPSPIINREKRIALVNLAIKAASALSYENIGTFEFLTDGENFYFIEINPRLQVEHPVTEMVTGVDLVKTQILLAQGAPLNSLYNVNWDFNDFSFYAIECRITAEDPQKDFAPSTGRIESLNLPGGPGVRVDTHIYSGYEISPYYDSLIGKIITWDKTRDSAIKRMERALTETRITGIDTIIPFHLKILRDPKFLRGEIPESGKR